MRGMESLSKVFPGYVKDPSTGQYKNMGERRLSVTISGNRLLFNNNGLVKSVLIKDCGSEFVYQIRKRYINVAGGAAGLYSFLKRELRDSATGGFYLIVFNKVFKYMS